MIRLCRTDVGIFVDRDMRQIKPQMDKPFRVLVPYMGSTHDRLAMELGARIGRNTGAAVTVLHVVSPSPNDAETLHAKTETAKVFEDPRPAGSSGV